MNYLLSHDEMREAFRKISEDYETIGSVDGEGEVVFSKVENFDQISEKRSRYAPKEFLIERNESALIVPDVARRAVFGVKSCDLKGFYLMDKQMLGRDKSYTARREKTLFVNFVCNKPCEGGFCSSFGGPVLDEYDIQILRMGDAFHVAVSEKYDHYFTSYKKEDEFPVSEINDEFSKGDAPLPVEGIEERLKMDSVLWKDFASRCISCGACTFSCPTCYCFDVYKDGDDKKKEWDSCILPRFKSSPPISIRKDLDGRLRQRFYHKFNYYKKARGVYLCTGCNRCVEDCPVGIDIKEVITHDYLNE